MNPKLVLGLVSMAFVNACGHAPKPIPVAAGGVAEAQAPQPRPPAPGSIETARHAPVKTNVVQAAQTNDAYRRVLVTGEKTQLVVMTIPVGSDIGFETHPRVEQLLFIVSGEGKAIVDGTERPLASGDVLVVTPGTGHDIVNTGNEPLRLYTVYAPPNHIDGRVHPTKAEAEADTADEAFGRAVR
jgi:mannose-6-phosphate isomerase-like protein (cupin superfamily)